MNSKNFSHYDQSTLNQISHNFLHQLQQAEQNNPTSLAFAKHQIPKNNLVDQNQPFQIIVIGGTNLTSSLATLTNSQLKLIPLSEETIQPLTNKQSLLDLISRHYHPDANLIALNFAFPLKPFTQNDLLDGQLIKGTKEHTLSGLEGQNISQTIQHHLNSLHHKDIKVSTANDTVCLAMAGLQNYSSETLIALVLGTGSNAAIFSNSQTVVNLEFGNFKDFPQTQTLKDLDQNSDNPLSQLLEKQIAGGYLHQHFNLISKQQKLGLQIESTKDLHQLCTQNNSSSEIANQILDTSASLLASILKGIYLFRQQHRLNCITEGSLFWKGLGYKQRIDKYLNLLEISDQISFIKIENSSTVGAAHLITPHVKTS